MKVTAFVVATENRLLDQGGNLRSVRRQFFDKFPCDEGEQTPIPAVIALREKRPGCREVRLFHEPFYTVGTITKPCAAFDISKSGFRLPRLDTESDEPAIARKRRCARGCIGKRL